MAAGGQLAGSGEGAGLQEECTDQVGYVYIENDQLTCRGRRGRRLLFSFGPRLGTGTIGLAQGLLLGSLH